MTQHQTASGQAGHDGPPVTLPALPSIVRGEVRHHRLHPISHRVGMTLHLWLVDLADADPRKFRIRDHFDDTDLRPIREKLIDFAAEGNLVTEPGDRHIMLAAARASGHVFNPLSVHWCLAPDGTTRWAVLEVHNTYGARHAYPLVLDQRGRTGVDKKFYVSPFFTVDGTYAVTLRLTPDRVAVSVNLSQDDQPVFTASFIGTPTPATLPNRMRTALRTPLVTHQTSVRIRLHGIWLYLRRLPIVPRSDSGGNL